MNQSDLPGLKLHYRGKVGDMYDLGEYLLLVATDRISGFDVVNAALIPQKGAIRTQLSRFWFERTEHIVPNHLVSTDLSDMSEAVRSHQDQLDRRAMLVRKAQRVDIECVGPGLSRRLRLEGVPEPGNRLRTEVAGRPPRERPAPGTDIYAGYQGRHRTRREHKRRAHG